MNRFFVPGSVLVPVDTVEITDAQDIHHIQKVLRLKSGDVIEIANGEGAEAVGVITAMAKTGVSVEIKEVCDVKRESPLEIVLYQGLPKGQKLEVIFQKNTEIGVNAFVPVVTERSVARINDMAAENKKRTRWQMIIDEAAKQSKRGKLPILSPVVSLKEALGALGSFDLVLVPHTGTGTSSLADALKRTSVRRVAVFIGPEGGFSNEEAADIVSAGGTAVTLGPRILRTETAGFVASSILQYIYGDMGGLDS